jgi:BASS family bile acid:Na+ symporter
MTKMATLDGLSVRLAHVIHHYFIWFVIGSYIVAGFMPGLGLWIRAATAGEVTIFQERIKITLPLVMLAMLLFNAGLGVEMSHLKNVLRRPTILVAGLAANLLIPIAFIFVVTQIMRLWHNPDEVQNILVGLALVASMPIAGSSTAWSQNANGNLALSLGLVLGSTVVSPLTTPLALRAVGLMTTGDYSEDLHEIAAGGMGAFLGVWVILPSLLGILVRGILGETRMSRIKPHLKLLNFINLLTLNYSNAAVSLPESVSNPDPDLLVVVLAITASLCGLAFGAGWYLARLFKLDQAQQASLMFGLGMNNNGTGLVLASMALADHPRVMLPIIFYNLVQHLVAGTVDWAMFRKRTPEG